MSPESKAKSESAIHKAGARDKAAHDKYQNDQRHIQFINENKAGWAKVRVFDSYVEK